jgi:hypothetical protein
MGMSSLRLRISIWEAPQSLIAVDRARHDRMKIPTRIVRGPTIVVLNLQRRFRPSRFPRPSSRQPRLYSKMAARKLDIQNYAILGDTLYDLTPGHRRRIGLSELDLEATVKENDDRGIDFRLPPSTRVN